MKKMTGLGRGLGALMDVSEEIEQETIRSNPLTEIDIDLIDVNKEQARKAFDEDKLMELCDSIKLHGIIQPLILTEKEGRYTIVAGERRYRAARMAGIREVPAVVRSFEQDKLLELSLIENIQREDLNPVEEARAILALMQEHGYTQETVSERIGRSRSAVANTLRLLSLPSSALDMVKDGRLSAGHARALIPLKEAAAIVPAAETVISEGLSVRAAEELVRSLLERPAEKKRVERADKPAEVRAAETALSGSLDTRVAISGTDTRGRIVIEYFSADQLQLLYERLMGKN